MSVLEFIGALEPWPASKCVEDVRAHKSRLLLQANALHAAVGDDAEERLLALACDHGAAVWEQWLLVHDGGTIQNKQRCAHSALTLAERSGDWGLVGEILTTWRGLGPTHARFYREASQRYELARELFERTQARLWSLSDGVVIHGYLDAARTLLNETEADDVGLSRFSLYLRSFAHSALDELSLAFRDALAACLAMPVEEHFAKRWLALTANCGSSADDGNRTRERALGWFDASMVVQAGALYLANERPELAVGALDPTHLIDPILQLERAMVGDEPHRVFALEIAAWALARRGEHARALTVLDEALTRMPTQLGLRLMRANIALDLGHTDAIAALRRPLAVHPEALSKAEWRAAGRLLVRGGYWDDAIQAFRRGGVEQGVLDLPALNDLAIALARVGREEEAQTILRSLADSQPEDVVVRENLVAIAAARPGEMKSTKYDPYAALVASSQNALAGFQPLASAA